MLNGYVVKFNIFVEWRCRPLDSDRSKVVTLFEASVIRESGPTIDWVPPTMNESRREYYSRYLGTICITLLP
jgi:hypothetical protein